MRYSHSGVNWNMVLILHHTKMKYLKKNILMLTNSSPRCMLTSARPVNLHLDVASFYQREIIHVDTNTFTIYFICGYLRYVERCIVACDKTATLEFPTRELLSPLSFPNWNKWSSSSQYVGVSVESFSVLQPHTPWWNNTNSERTVVGKIYITTKEICHLHLAANTRINYQTIDRILYTMHHVISRALSAMIRYHPANQ